MIYTLENENIRVVASSNGGELHSIKKINDETEYLWNGDERYWKYHAPVLFPIVGKVNGGKYKIDGIEYELPQHGLARTREFKLIEKSESRIVFELRYDEETLSDFVLNVSTSYTKGVSIAATVSKKAKDIRETHVLAVKERAGKVTNTILLPMAIFQLMPMIVFLIIPILSELTGTLF